MKIRAETLDDAIHLIDQARLMLLAMAEVPCGAPAKRCCAEAAALLLRPRDRAERANEEALRWARDRTIDSMDDEEMPF